MVHYFCSILVFFFKSKPCLTSDFYAINFQFLKPFKSNSWMFKQGSQLLDLQVSDATIINFVSTHAGPR